MNRYRQLMKFTLPQSLRSSGLRALCVAVSLVTFSSCVYEAPPPRRVVVGPVVETGYIEVLPVGGRYVTYHGERCYFHNGHYYRRHPHRHGWVIIR
jgi:hypothetical protein